MRLKLSMAVVALVVAVAVGADLSAQQPPPQGGGARAGGGGGRGGFNLPPLLMTSDAFPDGGVVPVKYAGRGGNVQPGFKFVGAPEGTVSYAIIFHDIDVSLKNTTGDVLHWVVWNIPAAAGGIPEGSLPAGAVVGRNITGQNSYFGPGAPAGPRYHHYVFELYALNANLDLPPTSGRDELLKAMEGKIVAKSAYVGRYRTEGQ
jgi:Raf kinase inhibitor-like YbhB/YbcL family protein